MHKFLLCLTLIFAAFNLSSQNITVEISSCEAFEVLFTEMKNGATEEQVALKIDSMLATKPYESMLAHYNRSWRPNHLPANVFKRMIMSLQYPTYYTKGENQRADAMLKFWRRYYNDPTLFQRNIKQLKHADLASLISKGVANAESWLPEEWDIPDFYLYIHPNGGSTAFAYQGKQGYDFFQLPRDAEGNILLQELVTTISHESHHLGLKLDVPGRSASDSLTFYFLSLFIAEGTATKFVNNAPGGITPRVRNKKAEDEFMTEEWQSYTRNQDQLFERFSKTLTSILEGEMNLPDVQEELKNFWLSGESRYPGYFVGCEIFGAIYHGLGKQAVIDVLRSPSTLLLEYNKAREAKPELLSKCHAFKTELASRLAASVDPKIKG